jgi:dihydroxyacetone kinase-like protein
MGKYSIDPQILRRCLEAAASAVQAQESYLNGLDSAIGDGDHGITMRIGFDAVLQRLAILEDDAGFDKLLQEAGKAFMGATGGAIGPLLGGMLTSAGHSLSGCSQMGPPEFKVMLAAMHSSISRMGKAKPGDKTILDAVHAASQALAASDSATVAEAAMRASAAAAEGAESTAAMLCARGRASRLGERVLGHPDPGAVSFALILQAISHCLLNLETQG